MRPLFLGAALAALLGASPDTAAQPPKAEPKAGEPADSKFNMKVTTADIRLGASVSGAKLTPADLKDKVVMVDFWGVNCGPCLAAMPGTAALNAELADFGLVVVGSHVQNATPDQIKAVAAGRGANFPITSQTRVTGGNDFSGIPHLMVFDHTGACVFRGSPKEAEHKARLAVGEMLVAKAEREKFASQLAPVVADLKKGLSPHAALPRVVAQLNGPKAAAEDAKALLAAMTAAGQKRFDLAKEKEAADPVEAYLLVERVPAVYKGTPLAKDATALIAKLKKDKAVTAEVAARPALAAVLQFETALSAKLGMDKASAPEFQKANAAALSQLKAKVAQMKKSWPDARATAEAVAIAERFDAAP